jgi:hypothetical protein
VKADRLPRRAIERLTDLQRAALDEIRFGRPGPARRGELKTTLGWKRTREETIAYASDLLERGLVLSGVAARLDVEPLYLRRLLKREATFDSGENSPLGKLLYLRRLLKREATPEIAPRKPSVHAGKSGTNLQTLTDLSSRGCLPAPAAGFASFADLDRWLEERGR